MVWPLILNAVTLVKAALTNGDGLLVVATNLLSVLDRTVIR